MVTYFEDAKTLTNITYSTYLADHYLNIKKYVKANFTYQSSLSKDSFEFYKKNGITISFSTQRDQLDNTRYIIGAFHD
jgi:hypothetical protein